MIKAGVYKHESFNQTMFCYEISPPDYIRIWREDMKGNEDDTWWRLNISPQRFHWLVDEWNNGNIAKEYPHWWEQIDTRQKHINSLLQLSEKELEEVFNYVALILPHREWISH